MGRFINREKELDSLGEQYAADGSSFVVLYGRRRVGKTTLIREFIKDKPALYFHASEESEVENRKDFSRRLAEFTGNRRHGAVLYENWYDVFDVFREFNCGQKKILVIDELPYVVHSNPAFPSILQKIWESSLRDDNVMLILCGSLIRMMEKSTLNYGSPLYGRRTLQIKLKQIDFQYYPQFFEGLDYRGLIEHYAVTGGIPRYIELFDGEKSLFQEISRLMLERNGLLFEEPEFLLRHEVEEVGSYFSIIKSIAAGNCKASRICADIGVRQTSLPKYMKTLIDMDILEREVPVTESNPEKSKTSIYKINDNFIRFWFRFIYPERARIELGQPGFVLERIKADFVADHVGHIYENVCRSEMWRLNEELKLNFNKIGRWWNNKDEIDIVAIDNAGEDIVFAECKYRAKPMDVEIFFELARKKDLVAWNREKRRERFVLFSISGFTDRLLELAKERTDLLLVGGDGRVQIDGSDSDKRVADLMITF